MKKKSNFTIPGIYKRSWFFTVLLALLYSSVFSQPALHQKIDLTFTKVPLGTVLVKLSEASGIKIGFSQNLVAHSENVSLKTNGLPLNQVLETVLKPRGLSFSVVGQSIIVEPANKGSLPVNSSPNNTGKSDAGELRIKGRVTDEKGEGLPGVNVVVKGTQSGTSSDAEGNYEISLPAKNAVIVFSFVGYLSQEISPENRIQLDVILKSDTRNLDELVVVGYGVQKKSDLTGAISVVKAERLLDKPVVNIGQALSAKAAGVEVFENGGTPDGRVRIRIRGDNSINSSNDPLYVIDGVIGVADINLVNPNEIASLEILKDASATAIYGARGANGVILITTKRGINTDKAIITYDGYVSTGRLAKKLDLLNSSEWWQVYNTTLDNAAKYDPDGFAAGKYEKVPTASLPKLFDAAGQPLYDTDWQEETYRTALTQNHQIGIRGGNEKTTYSAYLGYLHRDALIRKSYLNRYTGRFNADTQLRSWLSAGANISFNYNKGNDHYTHYQIKRLTQEALPIIPVKYPDGTWGSNRDFPGAVQDTPARYLEEMVNQTSNTQVVADIYANFHLTKDLEFKSTFAVDSRDQKNNYYSGKNLIQYSKNQGGIARISTENQLYWQNENYFNWNKNFNPNHHLNLMLGASWQQRSAELLSATHQNFTDDFYQWHNLGAGTVVLPASSGDWRWSLNSYFARANYNLADKYLFTATGRYDGSSKFGKNNRYAFFPSFAFAWRVSDEDFLKNSRVVSNLKLRSSVGQTGNQEIANYAYSQNLGLSNVIFNDQFYSALYRSSFGNPDLKWEKTTQFDVGVDIGLLHQRIDVSLDYYHKTTSDLLLNAPIPYTSGLNTVMKNIGSVRNHGFELSVNTRTIQTANFSWETSVVFARNRNRILRLGTNDEDIFPGPTHAQGELVILRVGQPVGTLWGKTRLGTWGSAEAEEAAEYGRLPGDLKYADLNQDGKINNDDNSIIGRTSPDWTMGFSNRLAYRNLEFAIDLRFVQGNDVVNAALHNREDRSGVANGARSQLNAWTPENQQTMVAQRRPMTTYYDSYPDTHWMQDGSFIRCQNIQLGYNFPDKFLQKTGLGKLKVYVSAQNLFLISGYNGYDPEVSTAYTSAFGQGIDDFGDPRPRTYTLGLNVNF